MKMLKKCPLCGEPIDPENSILCTNCGNMLTEDVSSDPEEEASTHVLPDGTVLNKRYQITKLLGQGGFGITYGGFDTLLNTRVAIKEYYPRSLVERHNSISLDVTVTLKEDLQNYRSGLDSFLNEARNLAQFTGEENIVHVSDFFEANNTAYIVMEYVDGITIAEYIKQNGPMSFEQCMRYMEPVMKALEVVHGQNMIHRDISPSNLMIRRDGRIKLLDFGAARIVDSVSKSLSVIIRPGYTPIEQYSEKRPQGPYTDIFALCGTIYYMLTGSAPENLYERMTRRADLKRPSELGADIKPAQENAILKGLEVNPEDRFQEVKELCEALLETKDIPEKDETDKEKTDIEKTDVEETAENTAEIPPAPYRYKRILLVCIDVLLIIGIVILLIKKLTG